MSSFASLGVPERLADVLAGQGIDTPTPIQTATLPDSLAGHDLLGRGRTGSGKTYAFLLPLVARLSVGGRARPRSPRGLILAPTRELVGQIDAALAPLARAVGLSVRTVYGGVGQNPQVTALRRGADIVVATPGRLEDLIAQGHCSLSDVEITVLDEADHMSELGFLPAMRRLLGQTPRGGQRLLFSATLDKAINVLVRQFLVDPVSHQADSALSPVGRMTHHVLQVRREHRLPVLVDLTSAPGRTMVFTRTKHGAKALARQLNQQGVPAVELHGNLGQNARTRNLEAFGTGRASVLVATDIAARGIHVDDVTLVVHADPPAEHKAYLHRSGRTARAGQAGTVVTLMTSDQVRDVAALTKAASISPKITRIDGPGHPVLVELAPGERVLHGAYEGAVVSVAATDSAAPGKRRRSRNGERTSPAAGAHQSSRQPSRKSSPQPSGQSSRRTSGRRQGRAAEGSAAGRVRTGPASRNHSAADFSKATFRR